MFILNRQQVQFCQVVACPTKPSEVSPAITFNGSLFTKGETFPTSEKSKAFKRVQEVLEIPQELVLVLEDNAELGLYYLNPKARLLESQGVNPSDNAPQMLETKGKGVFGKLRHSFRRQTETK